MDAEYERSATDSDARFKGEILATLSTWTAEYGLVRLDLAWTVAQLLLKHTRREQGLDVYLEFTERLSAILAEEATQMKAVIGEDFRRQAH